MNRDEKPYRILVIEDNPGDFIIVEDLLMEQLQHPVIIHAGHFKQASSFFASGNGYFDVILLDLTLPDKTGSVLVNETLALASYCPVIILTGYTDIAFSITSIAMGISDYLIKDELNAATLYKSIIYAIERKKSIHQLEASEKRYSDLFQLSPQPMWVCTLDTLQFMDVNNAAINHYGYSRDEFLSMTIKDLNVPEAPYATEAVGVAFLEKDDYFSRLHHRHRKKNGEVIQVEFQGNVIVFEGKEAGIIVASDITEREAYIFTIENQNKKLRDIAWMQSHVVRAPLSRMMGLIDLIKNYTFTGEEKNDLLDHLLSTAAEIDDVIRNISVKTEKC